MPNPFEMMAAGMQGGGAPGGMPAGAPPAPQQPTQSPAGAIPPQLLWMLAGAGMPHFMKAIQGLQKGAQAGAPSAGMPHKPGMSIGAGRTPGQTSVSPLFLQQLAQRGQQAQAVGAEPPEGGPNPLQLLAMLKGGAG